jgi:hypothetical protein
MDKFVSVAHTLFSKVNEYVLRMKYMNANKHLVEETESHVVVRLLGFLFLLLLLGSGRGSAFSGLSCSRGSSSKGRGVSKVSLGL